MKLRPALASLAAVAALGLFAGCDKSSDVSKMADETAGIVRSFSPRVERLRMRAERLRPADPTTARTLADARATIEDLRQRIAQAPASINAVVQGGRTPDAIKLLSTYRYELETGTIRARANVDAVEDQLWSRGVSGPPPVAATPAAPTGDAPAAGHGAHDGHGH